MNAKNSSNLLIYSVLGFLSAVGVISIGYRLVEGLKVTALTSYVTWGIWVAAYIFFIGLSAGSFVVSALHNVFGQKEYEKLVGPALLSALFCLFGALVFIGLDIGHPFRFWYFFVYPNWTSILTIEAWLYVLYVLIILAELFLWKWPLKQGNQRVMKALGIVGLFTALGVHWGTGALFAVNVARPIWYGGLLPTVFLISALISGLALMIFIHAFFGERDENHAKVLKSMTIFMIIAVGVDLIFLSGEILTKFIYQGTLQDVEVWRTILFGKYWWVFFIGQIGMATLVPLILGPLGLKRKSSKLLGGVGLLTLLGVFAIRLNIVIPAFVIPEFEGLANAFQSTRLSYQYFPSINEFLVTVGFIACLILGYVLVSKLFLNKSGSPVNLRKGGLGS